MPSRATISTKTTRNKDFNYYETGDGIDDPIIRHTVVSTTATRTNPNIKLLDVNQAIVKSGSDIINDSWQNTTLMEVATGLSA